MGSRIAMALVIAGWSAACSTPTPTTGDATSQFATKDTALPMNYPVALPSNWQAYTNPATAPSGMPAGWPPSNMSNLPITWPSGYSPGGTATGPVDPSGVGPSSYTGNDTNNLPAAAQSAIPGGINLQGQGPDMVGGLFTNNPSQSVIDPNAAPMMDINQSQPWSTTGFSYQNTGGWTQ
jgi:hypothetical protein